MSQASASSASSENASEKTLGFERLKWEYVRVGEKLRFDVFNKDGEIRKEKGSLIAHPLQKEALIFDACILRVEDLQHVPPAKTSYELWLEIGHTLANLYAEIAPNPAVFDDTHVFRLRGLAALMNVLIDQHPDRAFGIIFSFDSTNTSHSAIHALHTAMLCYFMAQVKGYPLEQTTELIYSTLSMNISHIALHDALQKKRKITSQERADMNTHPEKSMLMLVKGGERNKDVLQTIMQHHETPNGTGYPKGLKGRQVIETAQMLHLADVFAAKLEGRYSRAAMQPEMAAKLMFESEGKTNPLVSVLIKALGKYPPGALVRFKSGHLGIVRKVGSRIDNPEVYLLTNSAGQPASVRSIVAADNEKWAILAGVAREDVLGKSIPRINYEDVWV
jgi:HD-GYP domain-containing protein (c-di-GMP phosphodiesterase class II)